MNCNDVQDVLPEYVGGGLSDPERARTSQHLAICSRCREEHEALRHVCSLLAATPAPEVQVDMPAIYREAARRARGRLRSWRRMAVAAAAAAVVLVSAIVTGVHVRFEGHQLVLRWGEPPPAAPVIVQAPAERPVAVMEEKLRDLNDLLLGLAADLETRDLHQHEELARLRAEFTRFRLDTIRQLAADRAEDALVSRLLGEKGTKP